MGFADGFYFGQNKIIVTSAVSGDSGKVVTVTSSGGTTQTQTLDSTLALAFTVAPNDKYTIVKYGSDGTTAEYTTELLCGYGGYHEVEVGMDPTTPEGIQAILNNDLENDLLAVGDEIAVTLNTSEDITLVIMAINHDQDGQVILGTKNALATTQQHQTSNTNSGGWKNSLIRTWLNETFLYQLPEEWQGVIAERSVDHSIGAQSTSLNTVTDSIWLPREAEIFTSTTYAATTEKSSGGATIFDWYATSGNTIKKLGDDGSAYAWWEASAFVSNSTDFCRVGGSGAASGDNASNLFGVAPHFHILKTT